MAKLDKELVAVVPDKLTGLPELGGDRAIGEALRGVLVDVLGEEDRFKVEFLEAVVKKHCALLERGFRKRERTKHRTASAGTFKSISPLSDVSVLRMKSDGFICLC